MIAEAPEAPALQDDRPQNEYYAIRWRQAKAEGSRKQYCEQGAQKIERPAHFSIRGPPGALFGIDQEAATLKVVPFG